jgi:hypothetical protein
LVESSINTRITPIVPHKSLISFFAPKEEKTTNITLLNLTKQTAEHNYTFELDQGLLLATCVIVGIIVL